MNTPIGDDRGLAEPVLVTGAAGFIGGFLARTLVHCGATVRGLVRSRHDGAELRALGIEVVRGDATDTPTVRRAAAGCGTIFHLAAERGTKKHSRRFYLEQNVAGARAVAEAALAVGLQRLIVVSTATICAGLGDGFSDEATIPRPNSGYRESRLLAERLLRQSHNRSGLPVVIVRLPWVLGPGGIDWQSRFCAIRDQQVRRLPRGGILHLGDVEDIVDGLRLSALVPGIEGQCFILAAQEPVPVGRFYAAIAETLGVPFAPDELPGGPFRAYLALSRSVYRLTGIELPHGYTCEVLAGRTQYDISRARTTLGFRPRFGLAESVARTATWLRGRGLL